MWAELFMADSDYLVHELDVLIQNLTDYSKAIKSGDQALLQDMLRDGREKKAAAGGN